MTASPLCAVCSTRYKTTRPACGGRYRSRPGSVRLLTAQFMSSLQNEPEPSLIGSLSACPVVRAFPSDRLCTSTSARRFSVTACFVRLTVSLRLSGSSPTIVFYNSARVLAASEVIFKGVSRRRTVKVARSRRGLVPDIPFAADGSHSIILVIPSQARQRPSHGGVFILCDFGCVESFQRKVIHWQFKQQIRDSSNPHLSVLDDPAPVLLGEFEGKVDIGRQPLVVTFSRPTWCLHHDLVEDSGVSVQELGADCFTGDFSLQLLGDLGMLLVIVGHRLEVFRARQEMPDDIFVFSDDRHVDRSRAIVLQAPHLVAIKNCHSRTMTVDPCDLVPNKFKRPSWTSSFYREEERCQDEPPAVHSAASKSNQNCVSLVHRQGSDRVERTIEPCRTNY